MAGQNVEKRQASHDDLVRQLVEVHGLSEEEAEQRATEVLDS